MEKYWSKLYKILLTSSLLFLIGCSSAPTSTGVAIELFDTEAYLLEEFEGISQKNIKKTIRYNDSKEIIEIKNYKLEGDLEVLKATNINNPNWTDKYAVEHVSLRDSVYKTIYRSVDPKLPIQELVVSMMHDEVIEFKAIEKRDALISSSSKTLVFQSNQGYSISTTSKSLISKERTITIDVRFQ